MYAVILKSPPPVINSKELFLQLANFLVLVCSFLAAVRGGGPL